MSPADELALIEAASSAYRERDPEGRTLPSPAFMDLTPEAREIAADVQAATRELERALDARGWSGTVQAVMRHILPG